MTQTNINLEENSQALTESAINLDCDKQDKLIQQALQCLEQRIKYHSDSLDNPIVARDYLRLQLAQEQNEVFAVLFLNNAHRVLAFERLFTGTINSARIHPRVIVQRALANYAAAVILAHNHPSGNLEPSPEDRSMTQTIKNVLEWIDVRVLDHIIVSLEGAISFAERGLL